VPSSSAAPPSAAATGASTAETPAAAGTGADAAARTTPPAALLELAPASAAHGLAAGRAEAEVDASERRILHGTCLPGRRLGWPGRRLGSPALRACSTRRTGFGTRGLGRANAPSATNAAGATHATCPAGPACSN
jgi:hypothetical protein